MVTNELNLYELYMLYKNDDSALFSLLWKKLFTILKSSREIEALTSRNRLVSARTGNFLL